MTDWKLNQPYVDNKLVEEISKNVSKFGYMTFKMQMAVYATYYHQTKWFQEFSMDFEVMMLSGNGNPLLLRNHWT